ncbi:MAG: hypothetical protein ABI134_21570, partial [Byssovorax sp.]
LGVSTDRRTLWIMRGTRPEPVRVRTGLTDGTVTEILEGAVNDGDLLVIEAVSTDDAPLPASSRSGGSGSPRMRF